MLDGFDGGGLGVELEVHVAAGEAVHVLCLADIEYAVARQTGGFAHRNQGWRYFDHRSQKASRPL